MCHHSYYLCPCCKKVRQIAVPCDAYDPYEYRTIDHPIWIAKHTDNDGTSVYSAICAELCAACKDLVEDVVGPIDDQDTVKMFTDDVWKFAAIVAESTNRLTIVNGSW